LNRRKAIPSLFYPLGLFAGMLGALGISLAIVILNLNPPESDVQLLFVFMLGSGSISVGSVYIFNRLGVFERFTSLRWAMLANIVLLVLIIFLNVWLTAQLMFISQHDFILTLALLIFAGVVSTICIFFVSNAWIGRIHRLGEAARRMQSGDLSGSLPVHGNDELAQLTTAFNQMVSGLQAVETQKRHLEQTRRDLVAWVSHDLRTPLAGIRAMNESILDGVVADEETRNRYIQTIQTELFHLNKMIDDLFELAQLDAGSFALTLVDASLHDLISDTIGAMTAKASQTGIHLKGQLDPGLDMVRVAPDKIQRVLYNLLDNALDHTPRGGTVSIQAQREGKWVTVRVHNTGSTIPTHDLPYVFESFYRGEPSRTQHAGKRGTGLGLAIVRGFVEAHGGTVNVVSAPEQGTTFSFTLPHP
jgi:signal transduction histidine kinase